MNVRTAIKLTAGSALAACAGGLFASFLGQSSTVQAAGTASCAALTSLSIPTVTIDAAQPVAAGRFEPPSGTPPAPFGALPSFCRVTATLRPSSDSAVRIEVWLPE